MKDYGTFFKKLGLVSRERFPAYVCITTHAHRLTCQVRVMNVFLCAHIRVLDLLEKVLRSSSYPHLLDDLLVEKRSFVLQLTAPCLSKWITSLSEKEEKKEISNSLHDYCDKRSRNLIFCPFYTCCKHS